MSVMRSSHSPRSAHPEETSRHRDGNNAPKGKRKAPIPTFSFPSPEKKLCLSSSIESLQDDVAEAYAKLKEDNHIMRRSDAEPALLLKPGKLRNIYNKIIAQINNKEEPKKSDIADFVKEFGDVYIQENKKHDRKIECCYKACKTYLVKENFQQIIGLMLLFNIKKENNQELALHDYIEKREQSNKKIEILHQFYQIQSPFVQENHSIFLMNFLKSLQSQYFCNHLKDKIIEFRGGDKPKNASEGNQPKASGL